MKVWNLSDSMQPLAYLFADTGFLAILTERGLFRAVAARASPEVPGGEAQVRYA